MIAKWNEEAEEEERRMQQKGYVKEEAEDYEQIKASTKVEPEP